MGDWTQQALAQIDAWTADAGDAVALLRKAIMQDGQIDPSEVRRLIALHKSGKPPVGAAGWNDLFVEAITDYFAFSRENMPFTADEVKPDWGRALARTLDTFALNALPDQPMPRHLADRLSVQMVSEADGQLLVDALAANGPILDATETRLLSTLFARAVTYPANLRKFAWDALTATVLADGRLSEEDVGLVRAIVMGPASQSGIAVSACEAEGLFQMERMADPHTAPAAWPNFFAQTIGNYLLYGGGTPGRVDVAEQAWLSAQIAHRDSPAIEMLHRFLSDTAGQAA